MADIPFRHPEIQVHARRRWGSNPLDIAEKNELGVRHYGIMSDA